MAKGKGKAAPKNLTLKRGTENGNASIAAKWGNPADRGYEGLDEVWVFRASKDMSKTVRQQRGNGHVLADRVWVRDKGLHDTNTMWYRRTAYHPFRKGRYLRSVDATMQAAEYGKKTPYKASASYTFKKPRKPVISAGALNADQSKVTFKVTTNEGKDEYERYDTMVRITRLDSPNQKNSFKREKIVVRERSTTSASYDIAYDAGSALSIIPGQWIRLRCKAYARGIAGNSAMVTRDYVHAYPALATVGKITCTSRAANGIVHIPFGMKVTKTAPVDEVRLQRLANTTLSTPTATAQSAEWEDVEGAVDNGNARGFSDTVAGAWPAAKNHTWYRIRTKHGSLVRYSTPVEATCLYHARDAGGSVTFLSLAAGEDGESLRVDLGWVADSYTTTQVSWSDDEEAWESNKQPEPFDLTWEDGTPKSGYAHSAHLSIKGLSSGKSYYVRARRVTDAEGVITYGAWCSPPSECYPVALVATPSDVTLTAPDSTPAGEGVTVSWGFTGDPQTAWRLQDDTGRILAQGDGPQGMATVAADVIGDATSVAMRVAVTCGGDWATSELRTVNIVERPVMAVSMPETIVAQPVGVGLSCGDPTATVVALLEAVSMSSGDSPTGTTTQAEGDVVWSDSWEPTWEPDGEGGHTATLTLPEALDLRDNATYRLRATATAHGLASAEASATAAVAWAHQAMAPSALSTVVPDPETMSADITPVAPANAGESARYVPTSDSEPDAAKTYYVLVEGEYVAVETPEAASMGDYYEHVVTDVCDVYRVTPDGSYLIAQDVPFGQTVTDRYAPYSRQVGSVPAYRLCTRTADGDLDWRLVEYELDGDYLRIDWAEGTVNLPYDLELRDQWKKSFSLSERWDGSRVGHWNEGSTRTSDISTGLIWAEQPDEVTALRALASYAGPCFVRTPVGSAYEAHVEVRDFGDGHGVAPIAVTLDITEVTLTDDYRIAPDDWGGGGNA